MVIESPQWKLEASIADQRATMQRLWGNDGDENEENESALGWTG